jgi:predicted AAA+ superfamily ATPase
VLLLTGPRQVGKTTLLAWCARQEAVPRRYVTLDDADARALARDDPALFLQTWPAPVIIDEVQYAPQLFSAIKQQVDRHPVNGQFWLTGSQKFHLMQGITETLAGRVAVLDLLGLTSWELSSPTSAPDTPSSPTASAMQEPSVAAAMPGPSTAQTAGSVQLQAHSPDIEVDPAQAQPRLAPGPFLPTEAWLEAARLRSKPLPLMPLYERIWLGGFPRLNEQGPAVRDVFFRSYVQTYLQRDVRDMLRVSDPLAFNRFLMAAAARTGQLLNIASMARDVDIDHKTARSWLGVLEMSGLVHLLQPYHTHLGKRLVKAPKLYFLDTGLAAYLTRWPDAASLEAGSLSGAILETWVVTEVLKSWWYQGREAPLHFYRDTDQQEVDLLLEQGDTLYPVEIKKTASPSMHARRHFRVLDKLGRRVGPGAVLCLTERDIPLSREVTAVPMAYL